MFFKNSISRHHDDECQRQEPHPRYTGLKKESIRFTAANFTFRDFDCPSFAQRAYVA
jgi:hypothetical protein